MDTIYRKGLSLFHHTGIFILVFTAVFFLFPIAAAAASYPSSLNGYNALQVPTQITKTGNTYFLVDCYHNQIIYSENLGAPLKQWKIMSNTLQQPHALASDGTVYLVVDTENHRVVSYEKGTDRFKELQVFEHIGNRPHYVTYEAAEQLFYVWSSLSGEMYLFQRIPDTRELMLKEVRSVPLLNGLYVRSFTIVGDSILFPCVELGCIVQVDKTTFALQNCYPVPDSIAGIVQITPIENYFYITVSSDRTYDQSHATILRTKDLSALQYGTYENLKPLFGNNGTPYYISHFDGSHFLIHEDTAPSIYRFDVTDDVISNIRGLH